MKIVFATLHVRRSAQAIPLAAACLAAALPEKQRAHTCLVDLFPDQSLDEMIGLILAEDPDLIAFPTYVWNRTRLVSLTNCLHRQHPELLLVAGGPEATGDFAGFAEEAPWLIIVRGEGEAGFAGLVETLVANKPIEDLPGIATMQQDGLLVTGPEPSSAVDCSTLPSPWLTGVLVPEPGGSVLWEISRGCAFSCDYCFDSRGQEGVSELGWARLKKELDLFVSAGVSQAWILDSTFNFPPERGTTLLELLLAKAPHVHFHIEARTEFLDHRTIHLLGQLSCSIQFGLQSLNPEALKIVHRHLDLNHLARQARLLESEHVIYGFDLIYGLPGDNYPLFRASLNTALGFSPNHIHIFPLSVLPGTRLQRQQERHGLIAQTEPPYEIISSSSWTPEDLQQSRLLAAATDLFYNTGRAVAYLPSLVKTLQNEPCELLEGFCRWAIDNGHFNPDQPATDAATALDAYQLHQDYLSWRFKSAGKPQLLPALLDLLKYHYNYAETLLGDPVVPIGAEGLAGLDLWQTRWQTVPQIRLVSFTYEIIDLMEMEDFDLEEFVQLFRPVGSVALFLRKGDDVFCESLTEDFQNFLRACDGSRSPQQISEGFLPRSTTEELVSFAVAEGLLQKSCP